MINNSLYVTIRDKFGEMGTGRLEIRVAMLVRDETDEDTLRRERTTNTRLSSLGSQQRLRPTVA